MNVGVCNGIENGNYKVSVKDSFKISFMDFIVFGEGVGVEG